MHSKYLVIIQFFFPFAYLSIPHSLILISPALFAHLQNDITYLQELCLQPRKNIVNKLKELLFDYFVLILFYYIQEFW